MQPTQILKAGGGDGPIGSYNKFLGGWGNLGTAAQKQRGIISFGLSPNRQAPFAGAGHDAIFNTWRRFRGQALFVIPPFVAGYYIMEWATHRNHYLNSKAGRLEFADAE